MFFLLSICALIFALCTFTKFFIKLNLLLFFDEPLPTCFNEVDKFASFSFFLCLYFYRMLSSLYASMQLKVYLI